MSPQTIVIKKYENRRLYDSTHSRYVNLDEVAQMVRDGRDVQVLDAVTGEDRTRAVLTQIVVEHAKDDDSTFPLDVLRQMVVASGRVTNEAALTYMRGVFDMYQNAYRAVPRSRRPVRRRRRRRAAVPHRGDRRSRCPEEATRGVGVRGVRHQIEAGGAEAAATEAPLIRSDSLRHRSAPRP